MGTACSSYCAFLRAKSLTSLSLCPCYFYQLTSWSLSPCLCLSVSLQLQCSSHYPSPIPGHSPLQSTGIPLCQAPWVSCFASVSLAPGDSSSELSVYILCRSSAPSARSETFETQEEGIVHLLDSWQI